MAIKALTLYQPWASLVALGEKRIETRSWPTKYRGQLAIHAAKACNHNYQAQAVDDFYNRNMRDGKKKEPEIWSQLPLGKVLAIGNLVDCYEITQKLVDHLSPQEYAFGDYRFGRFAWIFENVHQLKVPIEAKGMQRLWNFDESSHLVAIDPYAIGPIKIWTPKGIRSGRKLDRPDEDAIKGLEVA